MFCSKEAAPIILLWSLFMLNFISLISGSSGNATYISDGKTNILIDCGTSGKKIEAALKSIDVSPEMLDAILITHEHSDHIKGAGVMARKYSLPIYATAPTHRAMEIGNIEDSQRKLATPKQTFEIGSIAITPFSIPHDAADPVGYTFMSGTESAALATDIGCITNDIKSAIYGCSKVILESNHDIEMLKVGPYPYPLKQRILSDIGHLSNESAALAALDLVNHGAEHIMLGHLSVHNNLPEIAIMETFNILTDAGVKIGKDITLKVADRYKITDFEDR